MNNTNAIALWNSPNGVDMPVEVSEIQDLSNYIKTLSPREVQKIVSAFNSGLYDMATEYSWIRTLNILRDKVFSFGKEFVLEMLGRSDSDVDSNQDFLSEVDIINLAADLGFINKTAKMHFLYYSEMIKHYSSRDVDEEMDKTIAEGCIKNCIKYVLAFTDDGFEFSFNNFREKLKLGYIKNDEQLTFTLINSPYFYKRTTVRTLLNLSKSTQGGENENVLANMVFLIPSIWGDLLSDDRYPVGFSYSEAVSDGNVRLVKALKSVLLKVKGFDYVPENLRSRTFIDAANELLRVHFGANNFYNEPSAAKNLLSLGTSIPIPALGICITATLACKLGNYYNISYDAQEYLDEILKGITPDRWEYYFDQVLPVNETILLKLQDANPAEKWVEVINQFKLDKIDCKIQLIEKLIKSGKNNKIEQVKSIAKDLYDKIR